MKTNTTKFQKNLRIILAITGKDILDALKNKITLTVVLTMLFLVIVYRFLPLFSSQNDNPIVFLHDAGQSTFLPALEESRTISFRIYPSFEKMQEEFLIHAEYELALVLPEGFDQRVAAGNNPEIQGYALHWLSEEKVAELRADLERRISEIVGVPVHIQMNAERLYMLPESMGGFLTAAGTVIVIMMIGMTLVPNLMLEEKATKTINALLVSPASSGQIVIAKALTGLFYSLIFVASFFILNHRLVLQWQLSIPTVLLGSLMSVAMGLVLGTLIENRQQLIIVGNVLMFPMLLPIFLSSMSGLLPEWLITVMRRLPPVALSDLLRISYSNQPVLDQSLPRLALVLICTSALLAWESWLVSRSDR